MRCTRKTMRLMLLMKNFTYEKNIELCGGENDFIVT